MKFIKFLIVPIFLLAFLQSSTSINAQQLNTAAFKNTSTPAAALKKSAATDLKQQTADIRASAAAAKQARKDALSDLKVKACEARQSAISKRSDQMVKRVTNQLDVFAKIAQRVQEFYQTKLLPQGKIVANYDTLVSDITTKSAAIAPLLAQAQAGAVTFSCDKDRPAEQVKNFNQDMKAVITALEAYGKSVRNLIVAVKSTTGVENSSTNSAKPVTVN